MTTAPSSFYFLDVLQRFCKLDWSRTLTAATQTEFLALAAIYSAIADTPNAPGVYVSALAERMRLSVSMVSKMLKVLEEKGWIIRTIDSNSRRNTFVSLSDAGVEVYQAATAQLEAVHRQVAKKLGPEMLSQLLDQSARLVACYEEVLSEE